MLLLGITGTLGAGKGEIVHYLTTQKDFLHYSVRAYITEEIQRRGMPVNRDSMVVVANDLRSRNSPSYIVEQLYARAAAADRRCVIESLRTPGEVSALRMRTVSEQGGAFCLLAVDADPRLRYERIRARGSETDGVSFEQFLDNERREMSSEDPNKQSIARCMAMSDHLLKNDGTREELYRKVEAILNGLEEDR